MNVLRPIFLAGCCVLCSNAAGQTGVFKITQFPEAMYINEQSTFVVKTEEGARVDAFLDDRKVASSSSGNAVCELNLSISESGLLRFVSGSSAISFHVVKPSDGVELREKGGYLHSGTACAILLAEHRHPPKHSRKWEVVKVLLRFVVDTRPRIESGTIVAGDVARGIDADAISEHGGFSTGFWRHVVLSNTVSRINSLVEKVPVLKKTDAVVFALSSDDLERGITELMLRMKLEWCLQVLEHREFKHVFVVAPTLVKHQVERFPDVNAAVRIAAGGNGASPITIFSTNEKRPLTTKEWVSQVTTEMARTVKW